MLHISNQWIHVQQQFIRNLEENAAEDESIDSKYTVFKSLIMNAIFGITLLLLGVYRLIHIYIAPRIQP